MSLRAKAVSGVSWVMIEQLGGRGISLIVSIVLARILLPEDFGLIGMIVVFNAVGKSLVDAGMSQSIIRTESPDESDYASVFVINCIASILIYILLFMLAPSIARFYGYEVLTSMVRVYSLSIIFDALSTVQITRLTKNLDFKRQMTIQIPSLFIGGVTGIVLALMGFGVWSLVWMEVSRSIALATQYWIRTDWRPGIQIDRRKISTHFDFGYKLTVSGLLNTVLNNAFPVIIGKYFAVAQVGYFTQASRMQKFPVSILSSSLNKVTYPIFVEAMDSDERLRSAYRRVLQQIYFVLAPTMTCLVLFASPIFELVLGSKWLPAVPYFQLLCIAGLLYPINAYNLNILKVKGKSNLFLLAAIIKKTTLILGIVIAIRYGVSALILALVANSVISLFINIFFAGREIKYTLTRQLIDISLLLLPALIIGVLLFLSIMMIPGMAHWTSVIQIVFGTIVYSLIYLIYHYVRDTESFNEFRSIVKSLPYAKKIATIFQR